MLKDNIKVGDYVRTDDGLIGKIVSEPYEYKDSIGHDIDFGDNNIYNEYEMYQNIIKTSPSIIDLIEVGDYVNGYEVMESKYHYMGNNFIDFDKEIDAGSGYGYQLLEKDIKSIITHEQMEAMEYKIEN